MTGLAMIGVQELRFALPPPDGAQVWVDFDGTISKLDLLDELIVRFAVDDSWRSVEDAWQAGVIGSYECLKKEFDVLRVSGGELDGFLDEIELDGGARSLFRLFAAWEIPVTILSDGIDIFIKRLLARAGIAGVPVRANTIRRRGNRLYLECPYRDGNCELKAAHCKCSSMQALGVPGRRNIYIGDGRSDLCAARQADVVFAKATLATCLGAEGKSFIPFRNLNDVEAVVFAAWGGTRAVNMLCCDHRETL